MRGGSLRENLLAALADPSTTGVLETTIDGKSLVIYSLSKLTQLLPRFFNGIKVASFYRNLNLAGFRRDDRSSFDTCVIYTHSECWFPNDLYAAATPTTSNHPHMTFSQDVYEETEARHQELEAQTVFGADLQPFNSWEEDISFNFGQRIVVSPMFQIVPDSMPDRSARDSPFLFQDAADRINYRDWRPWPSMCGEPVF